LKIRSDNNNTPPSPNLEEAFENVEVPADIEAGARNNNIDDDLSQRPSWPFLT
jgi:hypothetical protein